MARAVGIHEPGGPEVLRVIDRVVRDPEAGEVRIAVAAAAVNPTDIALRAGFGVDDLPPPWTPGMDAAGVVESVAEDVDRLAVGDEVMAVVSPRRPEGGAQAELVVVPAASVVEIPDGASLQEAATLPMNGLTAMLSLELLGLDAGQSLVVTGGAGLLASYAIPLAKERGLRVIADAQPADEALVRSLGADVVLPRGEGFPVAVRDVVAEGADGALDTALFNRAAFPALRDGGVLVPLRGWHDGEPVRGIDIRPVLVSEAMQRTDWLEELRDRASRGMLALRVAAEFPPEHAADAQSLMEAGGLRGRALIVFS
jgi:NADPH:quinone reductase-like Zn-dependent oxidoreductase